jgi:chemotaxis protein MotB
MGDETGPPIIVIKKKGGHGGHHGGAWKVAYADFVTAMMALFIVLWLLSSSESTKKAVGGYFNDPKGYGKQMGSTLAGNGEGLTLSKDDMSQIKTKIEQALKQAPNFNSLKDHIMVTVTGEGLRIELLETQKGMFFESGNAKPSEFGEDLLQRLAKELGTLPNRVLIEGHTDSKPFTSQSEYSNWELSADRANTARRIMQEGGLRADQVSSVRGFADQQLRNPKDAMDPGNRRISVIVQYVGINATREPSMSQSDEKGQEGAEKEGEAKGESKSSAPEKAKEGEQPKPAGNPPAAAPPKAVEKPAPGGKKA